jgi:hypothetical protein
VRGVAPTDPLDLSPLPRTRFQHARVVLLQYQTCGLTYADGNVSIPISVETVYGLAFAKLYAKNAAVQTARASVDISAEPYIGALRASALSTPVGQTFSNVSVLSKYTLQKVLVGTFVSTTSISDSSLARSASSPGSTADCNAANPTGNVWQYFPYPYTPIVSALQNCCATACSALLASIGVSPTTPMITTCCGACNMHNCNPADTTTASAYALMTVVPVPSLLNPYVTTVNITL